MRSFEARNTDPVRAGRNFVRYLDRLGLTTADASLHLSDRPDKKYYVLITGRPAPIYFGDPNYEDYTAHRNEQRRASYLRRSAGIRGQWRGNPFSPNNLAINVLWA